MPDNSLAFEAAEQVLAGFYVLAPLMHYYVGRSNACFMLHMRSDCL